MSTTEHKENIEPGRKMAGDSFRDQQMGQVYMGAGPFLQPNFEALRFLGPVLQILAGFLKGLPPFLLCLFDFNSLVSK